MYIQTVYTTTNRASRTLVALQYHYTTTIPITYLRPLQHEILAEVAIQDAVEDDRQTQDEVEASVHPGLVQGSTGHSSEVTAVVVGR